MLFLSFLKTNPCNCIQQDFNISIFSCDVTSLLVTELISSTDEKEKQDPLAFRDAIIQGLQEIGNNDLDQVSAYFVVVLQNHSLIIEIFPVKVLKTSFGIADDVEYTKFCN